MRIVEWTLVRVGTIRQFHQPSAKRSTCLSDVRQVFFFASSSNTVDP
jgi:hypothetical protein